MNNRVLNSKNLLFLFFFIVILILAGEGIYYWRLTQVKRGPKEISPAPKIEELGDLQAQAKKAGYELIYQANPYDTTGRAILASSERKNPAGWHDKFGEERMIWRLGSGEEIKDSFRAIGLFKEWRDIPDSKDKYIIVTFPEERGKERIGAIRVAFEQGVCTEGMRGLTNFRVDNLIYGPENPGIEFEPGKFDSTEDLGRVFAWDMVDLNEIIKPGDVISFLFFPLDEKDAEKTGEGVHRDEQGSPCAVKLIIRRFGGTEQLEKELGRKL